MAVEIFQRFLTGTAMKEFERILHKVAWRLFERKIQVKFNSRICQFTSIDYANAKKSHGELVKADMDEELLQAAAHLRSWIKKNDDRKEQHGKVKATTGLKPYARTWPPTNIPPPLSKQPTHDMFFAWADSSGINATSACVWLHIHNHGWEFSDVFQREIFLEVQEKLAFKSYGKKAGRTQIDYLSKDLVIEGTIKLSKIYSLVEAHLEAQPYFPPIEGDTELGKVLSAERKTRILWQAAHEPFKEELTNLHITKYDYLESWEHAQEKFLLTEERRAKLALSKAGKKKPAHNTSSKPKNHQNKKDGKPRAKLDHMTSNHQNNGGKGNQNRKGGGSGQDDHRGGKASNTKKRKGAKEHLLVMKNGRIAIASSVPDMTNTSLSTKLARNLTMKL